MIKITLRQLEILQAVARCGSFSRASEALHLTQPAVSMQIDLDLSPEGGDTFRMETPGYLLHHWDGSVLNSHICQIPCSPTFSGPHPFVGSVNPVEG